MENNSPSKPSVAELAGRLKGHIPMAATNDESFQRRPPCSLKLQYQKSDESDKTFVSTNPFKVKMKNSPIIEKLQVGPSRNTGKFCEGKSKLNDFHSGAREACMLRDEKKGLSLMLQSAQINKLMGSWATQSLANLALSPTALLPSPKSPEVKLQPAPLSPTTPCSPLSPLSQTLQPSHLSTEEEDPISFDSPPEGAPLQSINKTRARLSFKRRLPTRQHRRSAGEEAGAFGSSLSSRELYSPKENGDQDEVVNSPAEEDKYRQLGGLTEAEEKDRDCEKTEDKEGKSGPNGKTDLEEEAQTSEEAQISEALEEETQPPEICPLEQIEGDDKTEEGQEETSQEAHQEGNDEARAANVYIKQKPTKPNI